jgi:glycosyltransferase involved in cell wall biosynthesis
MKIAILGTKGIPNNYGGYEQFAEFISTRLVALGHSVTVYNPHYHPYKEEQFRGVKILRKYSPEKFMGGAANFVYDYLCLTHALKQNFDIIYEAGYHSVAPAYKLLNVRRVRKPVIVTNMDGLEYKRSKWSRTVQQIIEHLEGIAVRNSPHLIADNLGIYAYLKSKYRVESLYLPYGADVIEKFDPECLAKYSLQPRKYLMLIARIEPENNVETIIQAHLNANCALPLIVVGSPTTSFGKYLTSKYQNEAIRFVGGIYNKSHLDSLRHFSLGYFHGHSVGGTNPSLLEAMACETFIISHNNPFNSSILGGSALYFDDEPSLREVITNFVTLESKHAEIFKAENAERIKTLYNWDVVTAQHEQLFQKLLEASQRGGG